MALSCIIFVYLFNLCLLTSAQTTHKNITLGSTLVAGDNSLWLSPSNDFAFGFQQIQPGSFLLALWFNKIPEKTITWSANRDQLAPKGSKVELTSDGNLILTDPSGRELWKPKQQQTVAATAAVLDTGNFILIDQNSGVVWQSFDEPTDTLLPTQNLNQGSRLIASFTSKNYSSGRFSFDINYNGNVALYTTNFPLFNSLNSMYQTFEDQGLGYQVVFSKSGSLNLVDRNGNVLVEVLQNEISHEEIQYHRVILDYDGVLRHYIYPKNSSPSKTWFINSFTPDNICTAVIQQTGSGVCGFNSYCKLGNDRKPKCVCPPGYAVLDPTNEMSGCFQNFPAQSCNAASTEKDKFDFKVLQDVDWPLSDYEHFENVSIEWCKQVCLNDCFCAVAIYRNGGDCWKKKTPLSNGKNDSSVDRIAFIKTRINGGSNHGH